MSSETALAGQRVLLSSHGRCVWAKFEGFEGGKAVVVIEKTGERLTCSPSSVLVPIASVCQLVERLEGRAA